MMKEDFDVLRKVYTDMCQSDPGLKAQSKKFGQEWRRIVDRYKDEMAQIGSAFITACIPLTKDKVKDATNTAEIFAVALTITLDALEDFTHVNLMKGKDQIVKDIGSAGEFDETLDAEDSREEENTQE